MQLYYDPHEAPDPEEWQMLDEAERSVLVQAYHEEAGIDMPNVIVHSAIHTTVENQAALGDELPVRAKLDDLIKEGLDRHEAVHAVGSLLATLIYNLLKRERPADELNEEYLQAVSELTAESWTAEYSDFDE